MRINVFGNSLSNNSQNKFDTTLLVKKPYLRSNYIESNIEEDIDSKNQYRIKNIPDPISFNEAVSKKYVDNSIDEVSLVRNNKDNDFGNYNLTNINSITLTKQAVDDNEVITKAYVDQFHQDNERSRRDIGLDFHNESSELVKNNQDNDFNDNKLTNIDSIQVNRDPISDNEVSIKKYVDNELDKNTLVRFIQTLTNYLKISVGNDTYNLTKYDKNYITDLTEMGAPNSGVYLLQKWKIDCRDRYKNVKIINFIKSTKSQSLTEDSGATGLPPIGNSFMYLESSGNNYGYNTYVKLIRTDFIQITNISFYHNRYSISDENFRAVPRFRIEILLENGNWENKFTIKKNTQYAISSTKWTHRSLNFTQPNYGIRLIFDRIDTAHADMSFSNISITHTLF